MTTRKNSPGSRTEANVATGKAPCGCANHAHSHSHAHGHGNTRPVQQLGELTDRLREKALRVTGPRQAVLDLLRARAHPLSNKEIFDALPHGLCDLATVYRSMNLLEEMGMVRRYDFGDGVARWELLREGETGHHHHLICTRCSTIVELDECIAEDLEREIGRKNGFTAMSHKLEFFGICPSCR